LTTRPAFLRPVKTAPPLLVEAPLFPPLPCVPGGWACVSAECPKGQGRAPSQHYGTHKPAMMATLPVKAVLARDAWLFLWWPDVHEAHIQAVMKAWGFKFSGKAFTWIKLKRSLAKGSQLIRTDAIESALHFGLGKTTRKNSEVCWLGWRGSPAILSHSVREVIIAPVREHSRKPREAYERIKTFCGGPRLDLFGRESREGWTIYGDEANKFDREAAE
jgi:N6-adenosine-specific RNA methylase IME4